MDGEKIYRHGGRENFGENKRKNPNLNPLTLSRPPFPKKKKPEATLPHKPCSRRPPQNDLLPLRAKHRPPSPLRSKTRETKRATAAPAPPLASQRLFFHCHPRETSPSPSSTSLSSQPVFTASEQATPGQHSSSSSAIGLQQQPTHGGAHRPTRQPLHLPADWPPQRPATASS